METPILEQLDNLRSAALDPNTPVEDVQLQLAALIDRVKNRMDLHTLSHFLRLVAERADLEASIGRRRMERAAMFAQLVECEVEQ
jgi:hypothetical protein